MWKKAQNGHGRHQPSRLIALIFTAASVLHGSAWGTLAQPVESDAGPTITHFGIASVSDAFPVPAQPQMENGRQIYVWPQGHGFWLVIEARPGSSGRAVGVKAFNYNETDPTVLPDLQVLLSQSIGNGDPAVCETEGDIGIPGIPSLVFTETRDVADAINDLGCRFLNGQGEPVGRQQGEECTQDPQLPGDSVFVNPTTTLQFCALVARDWAFPIGDTIVAARARDAARNIGPREEMVVRITGFDPTPTTTVTPTPRPSRTPTWTRSPSPPPPPCAGDCNGNGVVTLDELIKGVNIALEVFPVTDCRAFDRNGSGEVTINELTAAVNAALNGCD